MRKQWSKSEKKLFLQDISFAENLVSKKSSVIQVENRLYVDNILSCIQKDGVWYPSLAVLQQKPELLPRVVVDKGAIRFLVNGADIMRPGIIKVESFSKGAFVVIVDETVGKAIAVGKALVSSQEMIATSQGKVIKNIHYVGDELWSRYERL